MDRPLIRNALAGLGWLLAVLAPALAAASALANPGLQPFTSHYRITVNGTQIGKTRLVLEQRADGDWEYRHDSEGQGLLGWLGNRHQSELSRFQARTQQLRPLHYLYERQGIGPDRHARLAFHWPDDGGAGEVINEVDDSRWRMDIPPGTLDKLLVRLALIQDLARERRPLEYPVADGGHLKHYRYVIDGEARVSVPAGEFDTLRLRRLRDDAAPEIHFWLAPALDYQPVRVEQRRLADQLRYATELLDYRRGSRAAD